MLGGPTRRDLVIGISSMATLGLTGTAPAAERPLELGWSDLIPEGVNGMMMEALQELGIVQHGQLSTPFDQEAASAVVTDYNDKLVRIPGFVVPFEYIETGISEFILVPYVGACIHVPPPPPNQLVFVQTRAPFAYDGMWDPYYVTGKFSSLAVATQLADIGYAMIEAEVAPYS